jgi:hypothetical protein
MSNLSKETFPSNLVKNVISKHKLSIGSHSEHNTSQKTASSSINTKTNDDSSIINTSELIKRLDSKLEQDNWNFHREEIKEDTFTKHTSAVNTEVSILSNETTQTKNNSNIENTNVNINSLCKNICIISKPNENITLQSDTFNINNNKKRTYKEAYCTSVIRITLIVILSIFLVLFILWNIL